MPIEEQQKRMAKLQSVVRNNTVQSWASQFIHNIRLAAATNRNCLTDLGCTQCRAYMQLLKDYRFAKRRLLLLDYDGTLVSFHNDPLSVKPDNELMTILSLLSADRRNKVVVISGRDRHVLDEWLGQHIPSMDMAAEHGLWLKRDTTWTLLTPVEKDERGATSRQLSNESIRSDVEDGKIVRSSEVLDEQPQLDDESQLPTAWKSHVLSIFEQMCVQCPQSTIEHKPCSIAWHYRAVDDQDTVQNTIKEFRHQLKYLSDQMSLFLLEGNRVLEVRLMGVDKGNASMQWLTSKDWDFVMAIGDDQTDEDTFKAVRTYSEEVCETKNRYYAVKVGEGLTDARYSLPNVEKVRMLLRSLLVL